MWDQLLHCKSNSPFLQIKAYLVCSKLRPAYLLAVKLEPSRAGPLVQDVLQAAEEAQDSVMQNICSQWLSEHNKSSLQRQSRPSARWKVTHRNQGPPQTSHCCIRISYIESFIEELSGNLLDWDWDWYIVPDCIWYTAHHTHQYIQISQILNSTWKTQDKTLNT